MFWPHMGGGFGWGGWIVGGLVMLLFLCALVVLIYFIVRSSSSSQSGGGSNDALEILKQRYARGDISKAEYDEMRRDLAT
ncbi:MAG: SHOCT domain-containing protein [Chloroflexota bacterium]